MQLRFPLPAGYFPKFELTADETLAFKSLVNDIVHETRVRWDHFVYEDGKPKVDLRYWKLTKAKDGLQCFRRRSKNAQLGLYAPSATGTSNLGSTSTGSDSFISQSSSESSQETNGGSRRDTLTSLRPIQETPLAMHGGIATRSSPSVSVGSATSSVRSGGTDEYSYAMSEPSRRSIEPMVIGIGQIDGTVDDIVYGLHESSTDEMKTINAFLGDDSLIDCAVLHTIRLRKSSYLGLKWKLTRSIGGNRDCCFIEYVGVSIDPVSGERYGYHVLESVPVGNCPPFNDNSIVRAHMSFCFLFRPSTTPGVVNIFMEGAFDSSDDVLTAGGVGDYRSATEMLFGISKSLIASEAKKLSALVAVQAAATPARRNTNGKLCSICKAKPGILSSHLTCDGCGGTICVKCKVKKVTFSRRGKIKVSCCKMCIMQLKELSPFEGEQIEKPALKQIKKQSSTDHLQQQDDSKQQQNNVYQMYKLPPSSSSSSAASTPLSSKQLMRMNSGSKSDYHSSMTDTDSSYYSNPSFCSSVSELDVDRYSSFDLGSSMSSSSSSALTVIERKMPSVMEGQGHGNYRPQYVPQYHQQQLPHHQQGYGMMGPGVRYPPAPPNHHNLSRRGGGAAGPQELYTQMLELQLAAERAYNLANQNANYMHQR